MGFKHRSLPLSFLYRYTGTAFECSVEHAPLCMSARWLYCKYSEYTRVLAYGALLRAASMQAVPLYHLPFKLRLAG
jgi:hypothetical protein